MTQEPLSAEAQLALADEDTGHPDELPEPLYPQDESGGPKNDPAPEPDAQGGPQ